MRRIWDSCNSMPTILTPSNKANLRRSVFLQPTSLKKWGQFQKERKRGSNMPYMFRLPFAQGGVFSANMLDRLLYQAIVKTYLVDFLKILLGIDQSNGSGYLSSVSQEFRSCTLLGFCFNDAVFDSDNFPDGFRSLNIHLILFSDYHNHGWFMDKNLWSIISEVVCIRGWYSDWDLSNKSNGF